jgi:preprotein translocase subunit YajC
MLFITDAFAQAAAGGSPTTSGLFGTFLPMLAIIPVFYFLMIRPQQKKAKDHRALIAAVKRGDRIVTIGGILGTVTKVVDNNELQLEIADGVRIRVLRSSVSDVVNRSEPAKLQDNSADKKSDAR